MEKKVDSRESRERTSTRIDKDIVNKYITNPNFPFLISFPRAGSHWLRMLIELYFGKPVLVRTFFYHKAKEFICYHTHDLELKIKRFDIIYLYREPGSTVFSQMMYHQQNISDEVLIKYWANIYGQHLSKWLIRENFTKKKTILCYDLMRNNPMREFKKICSHFDASNFNKHKAQLVFNYASKKEIQLRTQHDPYIINSSEKYKEEKEYFLKKYKTKIIQTILKQDRDLAKFINYAS